MYNDNLPLLAWCVAYNSRYDRFFSQVLVLKYLNIAKNKFFGNIIIEPVWEKVSDWKFNMIIGHCSATHAAIFKCIFYFFTDVEQFSWVTFFVTRYNPKPSKWRILLTYKITRKSDPNCGCDSASFFRLICRPWCHELW